MAMIPAHAGEPLITGSFREGGSIPAHAGEPAFGIETQVYPRARGGATHSPIPSTGLSPRTRGSR